MHSRAVYYRVAIVIFIACDYRKAVSALFYPRNLAAENEFDAVSGGVFRICNCHFIRPYNTGRRRVQCGNDFIADFGLHFTSLVSADNPEIFNAVLLALL